MRSLLHPIDARRLHGSVLTCSAFVWLIASFWHVGLMAQEAPDTASEAVSGEGSSKGSASVPQEGESAQQTEERSAHEEKSKAGQEGEENLEEMPDLEDPEKKSAVVVPTGEKKLPSVGNIIAQPQMLPGVIVFPRPLLHLELGGIVLEAPLSVAGRLESVSSFPVSDDGTNYVHSPTLNTQFRIGLNIDTQRALKVMRAVWRYEHDIQTGVIAGGSDSRGIFVPDGFGFEGDIRPTICPSDLSEEDALQQGCTRRENAFDSQLRHASLRLDLGYFVHVLGGFMTSHWGMGLVANDGAHGWKPGSALFVDPRSGDRTLRGAMLLGPFGDSRIAFLGGIDQIQDDDIFLEGDKAFQVFGAAVYGLQDPKSFDLPKRIGFYFVSRRQIADDNAEINVNVFDLEAEWGFDIGGSNSLTLATELAFLQGSTTLGPTPTFQTQDVLQLGAGARATLNMRGWGIVFDFLYASGDDNFDDGRQTSFRVDRNYPLGLLAHRYVTAAQTAYSPITANNPDLLATPSEDLERLPTRGVITNTVSFFPRGYWQPTEHLEIYGGPLLLFTDESLADAFQTRINGGEPFNALGGVASGSFLGTELDLGVRYRRRIYTTLFTLGLEGALFLPGQALVQASGDTMDQVMGGRTFLEYHF